MKILAFDSSGLVASVAIVEDNNLIAEYTTNYKKTHSQTLLPMLDEIVKMTETDKESFDALAVAAGPGSFTGLRIGSATVKGLAFAWNIPVSDDRLETVMDQTPMDIADIIDQLNERGEKVIFVGDGIDVYADVLKEKMTADYAFAPAHMNKQRAGSVAAAAQVRYAAGQYEEGDTFAPEYLRQSQAERERAEREKANTAETGR